MGRREAARMPILWRVDTATAGRYLAHVVKPVVTRPATSARLRLVGGVPQVAPDSPGLTLDVAASVPIVSRAVLAEQSDPLALPMVSSPPTVAAADATGITDEIARFQTLFSERGNRRTNLVLACARINGTIVKPGGVFSYNETVGPRVAEAGFRMAPVIVRGRMEPGMGGGICQVSSTLYNAAMLAGMGTVARSHHAFPVHYLPPGRDATVAYGSIDLKVRNTTDGAVGFLADASDGRVTIRVFGTPVPGRAVSIERTGVSSWAAPVRTVSDPSLPAGKSVVRDRGHAGHRVSVWRIVREGGRTVKRELLSRDTYRAFPRIIARGPAPAAPPDAGVLSPARASDPPDTPGSDL
jgi:vancomycin resistance protein YoaR